MQFAPGEDFARYPRSEADDSRQLDRPGATSSTSPTRPPCTARVLDGPRRGERHRGRRGGSRARHFAASRPSSPPLLRVLPDVAVFGRKDRQQVAVIRRMIRGPRTPPVGWSSGPTVRAADGLALSSRNAYLLGPEDRARAPATPTSARSSRRASRATDSRNATPGGSPALVARGVRRQVEPVEAVARRCDLRTPTAIIPSRRSRLVRVVRPSRDTS